MAEKRCKDCIWYKQKYWLVFYCSQKYYDDNMDDYLTDKSRNNYYVPVFAGRWGLNSEKCEHYTRNGKWWNLWKFWRPK